MLEIDFPTIKQNRIEAYARHKDFFSNGIKSGYHRWYCIAVYYSAENLVGAYFAKRKPPVYFEKVNEKIADIVELSEIEDDYDMIWKILRHSLYTGNNVTEVQKNDAKASFDRIETHVNALLSA